jgi:hypothetical protein
MDNLGVFIASFFLSSFAGLAAALRLKGGVTWLSLLTAFLNSGLMGVCISLLWFEQMRDNVYFLLGLCLLVGLSGMSAVEYLLGVLRRAFLPKEDKDEK